MTIHISPGILSQFPQTKVAVALVRGSVNASKKGSFKNFLSDYKQAVVKQLVEEKITSKNYQELPVCQSWDKVYHQFNLGDDKKSTIHNLLKRAALEGDKMRDAEEKKIKPYRANMGQISDIVDFYNCVSIETKTPMGALLFSAIEGDINLRYGISGEEFIPLGRDAESVAVTSDHIVYADDKSVLTWLWNYRDGKHCCVPAKSDTEIDVLIFADQADNEGGNAINAIRLLESKISQIGWKVIQSGVLNIENPTLEFKKG